MSNAVSNNESLRGLVQIQNGHPFPKRIEPARGGEVAVLQMKDLPDGMQLSEAAPVRVEASGISERYLLKAGDILFRSRGQTNTAVLLKAELGAAVVSAPLISLRVTSPALLPEYLCWWMNQPEAQVHFDRHARGTSMRMINREALKSLQISVPPIPVQQRIVELARLAEREQELMRALADKRKALVTGILMHGASENGNDAEEKCSPEVGLEPPENANIHSKP